MARKQCEDCGTTGEVGNRVCKSGYCRRCEEKYSYRYLERRRYHARKRERERE